MTLTKNRKIRARGGSRIRRHILELIYSNPGREIMLPSAESLAQKLKVARSTVNVVLRELRESGYIHGVSGVGTFSNAWRLNPPGTPTLPVGTVLYGDGRLLLYDAFAWNTLSAIGRGFIRAGFALQNLQISSAFSEESICDEINDNRCDCLAWIVPWETARVRDFMRYYQQSGRRLILVPYDNHGTPEEFNSVSFDYYRNGVEFGQALLREKRRSLWYLFKDSDEDPRLQGIRDAFAAAGESLRARVFHRLSEHDPFADCRELLAGGKVPDAVLAYGEHMNTMMDILAEHRVDTLTRCRLLTENHHLDTARFHGYAMDMRFDDLGAAVAALAGRLRENPELREKIPVHCPVVSLGITAEA